MSLEPMTERELYERFARGDLEPGTFSHEAHLRVAWHLLREDPAAAGRRMRDAIHAYVARHELPDIYHETKTEGWLRVLRARLDAADPDTFPAFTAAHPEVMDSKLLLAHWTAETLGSDAARTGWVEPDVRPL